MSALIPLADGRVLALSDDPPADQLMPFGNDLAVWDPSDGSLVEQVLPTEGRRYYDAALGPARERLILISSEPGAAWLHRVDDLRRAR